MLYKLLLFILLLISLGAKDIPSDNKIQVRLNIINGTAAECVMHKFYTQSGWIQIKGDLKINYIPRGVQFPSSHQHNNPYILHPI